MAIFLVSFFQIDATTGQSLSFEELQERTARTSSGLRKAGLLPGDVVCLYGANAAEFAEIFLSVTSIGAALTIANSQSTAGRYRCMTVLKCQIETFIMKNKRYLIE